MLNQKDIQIISHLRTNARLSLTEISKKTSIPISTIYTKLLAYRAGLIKKHTTLLDFEKLGYHTIALIFLSCEQSQKEALAESLVKNENINSVFKLNNEFQLMVEGVFRHVADVDEFLEGLESRFPITQRKLFYIVKELRRENFSPN